MLERSKVITRQKNTPPSKLGVQQRDNNSTPQQINCYETLKPTKEAKAQQRAVEMMMMMMMMNTAITVELTKCNTL
jgi:hypothetical protein